MKAELKDFVVTDGQKKLMVANLKKFDKDDPVESGKRKVKINVNHVKFLLGFIKSKPNAMTEDYERALDTLSWAISSGKIIKQEFGLDSYKIGKEIEEKYYTLRDSENETKVDVIAPKYEEGNIKCYHIEKIDSTLSEELQKKKIAARHRLLCNYGVGTGWCTASQSGTYHEIYKYEDIYIIHSNNVPVYQFIPCTKAVKTDHCQFMDINDHMPYDSEFIKMSYNVYKFVKKYFPEVFEYYKLEKYGLDNLGKIIMQLDDNPENESNILEKIKNDHANFIDLLPLAQYYIDKNQAIPEIVNVIGGVSYYCQHIQ